MKLNLQLHVHSNRYHDSKVKIKINEEKKETKPVKKGKKNKSLESKEDSVEEDDKEPNSRGGF